MVDVRGVSTLPDSAPSSPPSSTLLLASSASASICSNLASEFRSELPLGSPSSRGGVILGTDDPSLFKFLSVELTRGYLLEHDEERYSERREKMYTFMKIPREVEKFMVYGFLQCADSFLFVYTFLPMRLLLALWALISRSVMECFGIQKCKVKGILKTAEICDLLKGCILVACSLMMFYVDTSMMYHLIKSQSVIKLYIFYNMLEVFMKLVTMGQALQLSLNPLASDEVYKRRGTRGNAREVGDRLFSAFGQDTIDALFWTATEPRGRRRDHLGVIPHFLFAVLYVFLHSLLVLFQATTLNVAINSNNKSLLTIMMSNNGDCEKKCRGIRTTVEAWHSPHSQDVLSEVKEGFGTQINLYWDQGLNPRLPAQKSDTLPLDHQFVELKGSVFKKFDKNNLFQVSCSDVRERFHLSVLLFIVVLQTMKEYSWKEERFWVLLPDCLMVLMSEFLVDWIKHAFITRFNELPIAVYKDYTTSLAYDMAQTRQKHAFSDHSDLVARRMGFIPLPLGVVMVRVLGHAVSLDNPASIILLVLAYSCLASFRVLNSILMLGHACDLIAEHQEEKSQATSWVSRATSPINSGRPQTPMARELFREPQPSPARTNLHAPPSLQRSVTVDATSLQREEEPPIQVPPPPECNLGPAAIFSNSAVSITSVCLNEELVRATTVSQTQDPDRKLGPVVDVTRSVPDIQAGLSVENSSSPSHHQELPLGHTDEDESLSFSKKRAESEPSLPHLVGAEMDSVH
uniref:Protein TAPT1 homolog n=1 Tax=Timema poppense TaxID=170557 RepID=A0A7R9CYU8_TIMPO|nr:unnamed protein product [Timema poppensis]